MRLDRSFAFCLGWFCLCCLLTARPGHAAPFMSSKGYSLTPASGWKLNHSGVMGTDVFVAARPQNGFAPNLSVVVTPASPGLTLEQGLAQIKKMYPRVFTAFTLGHAGYETLGGVRAVSVVGNYRQGVYALWVRQSIAIHNGQVYTLTCTALAASHTHYDGAFDQMRHSLRWSR